MNHPEAGFNAYTYKRIPFADLSKEYDIRQIISAAQDGITIHAMYLGEPLYTYIPSLKIHYAKFH